MQKIPTTGAVEIVIQMQSETGSTANAEPSPAVPQSIENTTGNPTSGDNNSQVKLALAINTVKDLGAQSLNAAVSNIGLATGNYYAQQQAEKAISGVQSMAGLTLAFTNPYTAIAAVGSMGISYASEVYQQNREREIANYESAQMAKRLGYTKDRR